jgi:hypothetical protein
MLAFAPAIGVGIGIGMGLSASAMRILKAVEVAISVHRGFDAIAEHAKDVGVGSNSNDSDSINNPSKTTILINPEKTDTLQKKKIAWESGSKKTETKDSKGTSTGGGSNKEPDDGKDDNSQYRGKSGIKKDEYLVKKDPQNPNQKIKNLQWDPKDPKDSPSIVRNGKYGKYYKDPKQKLNNKDIWWTKDIDEHGKSVNKLYKTIDRGLEWIGDIGESGEVILNKHKSPGSKIIEWKDLIKIK